MALQEVERKRRVEYSGGRKARGEPRGSTTDPQARTMRMANGGYRPGYNVQFAADAGHGVIVAVSVTNSDSGQAPPMIEQRTGRRPKEYLVDAAYTDKKSVERLDELDGAVPERSGQDPFQPQLTDSAAVSAWSKRMGSAAGQEIYKERAPTIERVNADVRTYRTMDRMLVRGPRQGALECPGVQSAALDGPRTDQLSDAEPRPSGHRQRRAMAAAARHGT